MEMRDTGVDVPGTPGAGLREAEGALGAAEVTCNAARAATGGALAAEVAAVLGVAAGDVTVAVHRTVRGRAEATWTVATAVYDVQGAYRGHEDTPWTIYGVGQGATLGELWAKHWKNSGDAAVRDLQGAQKNYDTVHADWHRAMRALEDAVRAAVQGAYQCDATTSVEFEVHGGVRVWWRAGDLRAAATGHYRAATKTWYVDGGPVGPDLRALVAAGGAK
jgi:hypothetical protein